MPNDCLLIHPWFKLTQNFSWRNCWYLILLIHRAMFEHHGQIWVQLLKYFLYTPLRSFLQNICQILYISYIFLVLRTHGRQTRMSHFLLHHLLRKNWSTVYMLNWVFFQQEWTSSYIDCTGHRCQGIGSTNAAGMASVKRYRSCPLPDMGGSSQIQWLQHRACLSLSAMLLAPLWAVGLEGGQYHTEQWGQREKKKKNSVRSTPANTKGREAFEGGAQGPQRCFPAAHEDSTDTDIHTTNCGGPIVDSDGHVLTELQPVGTTHCRAGEKQTKK